MNTAMNIRTLIAFLAGRRQAILDVADTPGAVWLGMLLVLSAGFAREYDAQYLLREPWYLLLPLAASLVTSLLLYSLIWLVALRRSVERGPFWATFRRFLALYWMTAPLAWLYAIPVERFLSDAGSVRANLSLLAIVSTWRVALMTRAVIVFWGAGPLAAFSLVMFFASSVVLAVLQFTPLPIFNIMGGIPLPEREAIIQEAALVVTLLSVPVWFVSLLTVLGQLAAPRIWHLSAAPVTAIKVAPSLWGLAALAIFGWGAVLPFTQAEQRLRYQAERALTSGEIAQGLRIMSQHTADDFPPHWDPPPWLAYPNPKPPLSDVIETIVEVEPAPWVRGLFLAKLEADVRAAQAWNWRYRDLETRRAPLVRTVERLPERREFVDRLHGQFLHMWRDEPDAELKDRLRALLEEAGHEPVDTDDSGAEEGP